MSDPTSEPQPEPASSRSRLRLALAGVSAALPLIPIVIALVLSDGSGAGAGTTANSASLFKPVSPAPAPARASAPVQRDLLIPSGKGTLVALVRRATRMRSRPGGHAYAKVPTRTEFGSPEAMWAVRLSGRWIGVISPLAGNGRVGWIAAGDVALSRVDWELRVSLSARRLAVLRNGHTVRRYTVAIGRPSAPTPTGRFAVTDRLRTGDPTGPYGCCILALSAKAPHAIQGWSGGDRIAIHSTPETATIGRPVSHGCLRLTLAQGRWLLARIPLGTPTVISS